MDQKTAEKLERLRRFHTRYEISATRGAERVLVGYTMRKGRRGLYSMCEHNAEAFDKFFGKDFRWNKRAADGLTTDSGWLVNFSGRTQRDCILSGELPFFVKLVSQREREPAPAPEQVPATAPAQIDFALA
jgi:hypothetical protein